MPLANFKIGDSVKAVAASNGWGYVHEGDVGTVIRELDWSNDVIVNFPSCPDWRAHPSDLVLLKKKKERRTAKVMKPQTNREKVAVRLIEKVTSGEGKFTAVKVESEGAMGRRDCCTEKCTFRTEHKPHVGCKHFTDNKVANDFILRELAKHGLAKRVRVGENNWGHLYAPKLPLVFSKVYNDSETEWTTTLLFKKASDVLYAAMLVDAFNALAAANGNGINVERSGMHTAFLQGKDGLYPSKDRQPTMFNNFAKSMRPLLPALYLLGANRIEDGKGVTRSTSPRQPLISNSEKYSAIAYRYGAVEFRVFDTCYDNRDQLLDNIVVMAQSISKYWHKKYVKPNVEVGKPVYFGTNSCSSNTTNELESLYVVKEHVVILNEGLRCIKPPYLSVKEVKQARNFKLTVRSVKDVLNIDDEDVRGEYQQHLHEIEFQKAMASAREFSRSLEQFRYDVPSDIKDMIRKLRAKAAREGKKILPILTLEEIAYRQKFGSGFPLGEV